MESNSDTKKSTSEIDSDNESNLNLSTKIDDFEVSPIGCKWCRKQFKKQFMKYLFAT